MKVNDYIELELTHSIHTSERLSFRSCRRRHHWVFVDGWYPQTTAKPLEFGQAFHSGMEAWYEPMTWGKDPETRMALAILAFKRVCQEQKAKYLELNDGQIDPEVEQDYKERMELGEGMIRYHCGKISPKLDVGLTPVRVEVEFEVPITDPNGDVVWCRCDKCWNLWAASETGRADFRVWRKLVPLGEKSSKDEELLVEVYHEVWKGLPLTYGGRVDCLMEDSIGRLWVTDWKSAARLSGQEDGDSPDEYVLLDDQITSYCWALAIKLKLPIAGFIHHEMKKAFPLPPEPNKTQRKGCWYSVNKMQNTSYELYLETVQENDPTGYSLGAYDGFLEYLRTGGPRYYSRKQVTRSQTELEHAGFNIWQEAMEIINPNLRVYPSPGRFHCSFCAFRQPCLGTNRGEDVEYLMISNYEKRTPRYWKQNQPSTESKGGQ